MAGMRDRRKTASPKQALSSLKSGSMRRIIQEIFKHYTPHMILVVIGIIGSAWANVRGTLFLQVLIDQYITPLIGDKNPDFRPLSRAIFSIALVYVFGSLCGYLYNRLMVNVGQGTMRRIRTGLFDHMESLPISYFDTHSHGDIMSIYTNDTDTLRQFIGQAFHQLFSSLATIISVFISMCILNIPLTLITVFMVFFIMLLSGKIAAASGRYFALQQKDLGMVNGFVEEMMNGEKVIKVFCHEENSIHDFNQMNEDLRSASYRANTMANVLMPIVAQLGNLDYVIVAIIGAGFAVTGHFNVTIGTLVAFMTLNKNFNTPFMQMSQQLNSVVMAAAGADRIYALLDEPGEPDEGYVTLVNAKEEADGSLSESAERTGLWAWKHFHQADSTVTYVKLEGDIVMDDVDFGYIPDKTVLHHIKLFANKGQKLAFVGSTGAGKTTITNLINRFYDIQDGKIRYDGININKIKKADLRRSLGVVLQDTNLFTGTVMDNIRYGRLDATDEECMAASKLANSDGFIRHLPDGYHTMLTGNGANLSQGQRQLIAIARAAVADPPVLILDEATSSIDTRTEQIVQKGMDSLMKGRTTFVIAHRLSTVKNSDCIMVLEQGEIIERGNHEQLMAEKGRYYQLYTGNLEETA